MSWESISSRDYLGWVSNKIMIHSVLIDVDSRIGARIIEMGKEAKGNEMGGATVAMP